jgi:hypothetical protein
VEEVEPGFGDVIGAEDDAGCNLGLEQRFGDLRGRQHREPEAGRHGIADASPPPFTPKLKWFGSGSRTGHHRFQVGRRNMTH